MRNFFCAIFACILIFFSAVSAYGTEQFLDDMDSPYPRENIFYHNLAADGFPANLGTDKSYLILSQKTSPAYALYHVRGASALSVSIYSLYGTFASPSGGRLHLGGAAGSASPVYYDPGRQLAYLSSGGELLVYAKEGAGALGMFYPAPSGFTPNFSIYYGVNLEVSSDGKSFQHVSPTLSSVTQGASAYCQTYTASLPSNTSYIRVRLYDFPSVPDSSFNGVSYPVTNPLTLCLASVKLEGNALSWGDAPSHPEPPEPDIPEVPEEPPEQTPSEDDLAKPPDPEETLPEFGPSSSSSGSSSSRSSRGTSTGKPVHTSVGGFQKESSPGTVKTPVQNRRSLGRRYSDHPSEEEDSAANPVSGPASRPVEMSSSGSGSYRRMISFSSGVYLAGISLCITLLVIRSRKSS